MAKRIKQSGKPLITIINWSTADEIVREIGDAQLAINASEAKALDDINEAKAELVAATKPLQEKIKLRVRSLEVFVTQNKTDFGKAKSKKLTFGLLGWRKSTSIKISTKKTLDMIKDVFSAAKAKVYIVTKESVDKNALAKLTDEVLASIDAQRKVKEDFFVEPDLPEAVDYEQ